MKYTNTTFTRYLSLDSPFLRGNDDQALQARLGVPVGQCDDVFGPSTQRAVIAFQKNNENWEPPFILKGAVVAYNSGINNVRTKDKMDEGITGDDYGSDVIARAQYYIQHEELSVFRQ